MAASTASMCFRSDSLAVYSRINARVWEREGRALESVISFRLNEAWVFSTIGEIYECPLRISAFGKVCHHHPRDVESQLEQQQSSRHHRNVDPRPLSRRKCPRVEQRADY